MWWRARHADGTAGLGAGGLPQPNRQNDRALSGRRHHRLSRPSGCRWAQDRPWRHRHRREQARSRDHAWRGPGGKGRARWLYAVDGNLDHACHQQPDGYTLLMATSTTLAINKTLYKKLPYDPAKDFTPVAPVAGLPFELIINPHVRA